MSRAEASAPQPEPKMLVGLPTVEMICPNWSTQERANNSVVNLSWLDLMTLRLLRTRIHQDCEHIPQDSELIPKWAHVFQCCIENATHIQLGDLSDGETKARFGHACLRDRQTGSLRRVSIIADVSWRDIYWKQNSVGEISMRYRRNAALKFKCIISRRSN